MAQTPNQLKNLEKRLRFGKDRPPAKSPGRPRTANLREDILADYKANGAGFVPFIRKKHPQLYANYGWGKPVETVLLGGADELPPVRVELVEAAQALRKARREAGQTGCDIMPTNQSKSLLANPGAIAEASGEQVNDKGDNQ